MILIDMEMPVHCFGCPLKTNNVTPAACVFRRWYTLSRKDAPQTNEWCPLREYEIPVIKTKQVRYFDEDEKVWKIGEVIVDE